MYSSSVSQQMLGNNYSVPRINTHSDYHFGSNERSPASFSGRTSHNSDSDSDEFSSMKGLNHSYDDQQFKKEYTSLDFNVPAHTNIYHQGPEFLLDTQSPHGLLEPVPAKVSLSKLQYQVKPFPVMESPLTHDKMQAQLLLERRFLQNQARRQVFNDSSMAQNTTRAQFNNSLHSNSVATQPRPVLVHEFYAPRYVNNAPVVLKTMSSVLSLPVSHHYVAQPEHISPVSNNAATQRIQSASTSAHQQPSPSALRFQQQLQQQMMTQAAVTATSPQEAVNYGGMSRKIYQVQFKCTIRYFTLAPGAPETLGNGDFVVVEADRGEDVGIVTEVMTMKSFVDRRLLTNTTTSNDEDSAIGKILRPACLVERQTLSEKFRSEESILMMSRELAYKTYQLPLQIHNVEYQFDRHKLTIYYTAEGRVDFRNFVRDLFAAYKARIWMKKIDLSRSRDFQHSAAIALATGVQSMHELPMNMSSPVPPVPVSNHAAKSSSAMPPYSACSMSSMQQPSQHSPVYPSQHLPAWNAASGTMMSSSMRHVQQPSSLSMPKASFGTTVNGQSFGRHF